MSENLNTLRRKSNGRPNGPAAQPSTQSNFLKQAALLLPWSLLAVFAAVTWWLFGDNFERAREVELVRVVTIRAQDDIQATNENAVSTAASELNFEGPTLFQMAQSFMITTYNVAVNGLTGVARIVGVVADIAGSVGAIGDVLGGRDA